MKQAIKYFEARDYSVENVASKRPYDLTSGQRTARLRCSRQTRKGTG